ncbi:MAG: choice-of-anchor Q domain-containing protein [Solirubrobacterales bacterium]
MRSTESRLRAAALLCILAGLLWAAPAAASTYIVNSNSDFPDAAPGDNICGVGLNCSLRAAIEESNANAGPDTVQLPADTYAMGGVEPSVDSEVTILGAGSATTTLARGATAPPGRVLSVGPTGVLDMRDVTITDGILANEGAGIFSSGDLTLRRTVVTGNKAVGSDGGGIAIADLAGSTLIEDSTISDNEAGAAGVNARGGGIDHGFGAGTLVITSSVISGNRVDGKAVKGGGIAADSPLEVTDSVIASNTAKSDAATFAVATGSAIDAESGGRVSIIRTTIADNLVDSANAGFSDATLFLVGEVSVLDSSLVDNQENDPSIVSRLMVATGSGPLSVRGSTFSGNHGGLITAVDSTIENSTLDGSLGYAFQTSTGSSSTVRASTISDNGSGGLIASDFAAASEIVVSGSILSGNTTNCNTVGASTITSGGGNVEGANDCGFAAANDLANTDPLIGPLANNGGLTQTRAIPANSPAVDNFAAGCPPPATDQRGRSRPQGGACDSGAYEFDTPASVTIDSGPVGTTVDPTPVFTFSANEPVSGAECRLLGAGASFVACSSPASYGPLTNGNYTFEVRVIDSDGNPSPTASRSFTVAVPGVPGAADTEVTDPDVTLAKKLKVKGRELKVKVSAGAQEDVDLLGKGTVVVKPKKKGKGKAKTTDLKPVKKSTEGGERTILRLKYQGGKRSRQRLTKQLVRQIGKGKKARVRVQVVFTDKAGNSATEKRVARLTVKRRKS